MTQYLAHYSKSLNSLKTLLNLYNMYNIIIIIMIQSCDKISSVCFLIAFIYSSSKTSQKILIKREQIIMSRICEREIYFILFI